ELVPRADAEWAPHSRVVDRRVQRGVEKAAHRSRTLAAPQVDQVVGRGSGGQRSDPAIERLLLTLEQRLDSEAGSLSQGELQQQAGAHIAQVLDRRVEPVLVRLAPHVGDREDVALTS